MCRKHIFLMLSVLGINSVKFTDKLWYTKYIIREVMLKDIAAPCQERLGTPTPWIPMLLASPQGGVRIRMPDQRPVGRSSWQA